MTSYRLTTNDITLIETAASDYAQWGTSYRQWCPITTIPATYYTKFYTMDAVTRPGFSKDGSYSMGMAVSKQENSSTLTWMRFKFEIPYQEMESARLSGVPYWSQYVTAAMTKLDHEIERLIIQGVDADEDSPSINGMFDSGSDMNNATCDAALWNTAPAPITHCGQAVNAMVAAGFEPPYNWILSINLLSGMKQLHNAASDLSCEDICRTNYNINGVFYGRTGTTTDLITYSFPTPATDDALYLMFKPDVQNFRLAQVFAPRIKMNPELDQGSNRYIGYAEWLGTVEIPRGTSIQWNNDVDLA
jgi:hypothetical protein